MIARDVSECIELNAPSVIVLEIEALSPMLNFHVL